MCRGVTYTHLEELIMRYEDITEEMWDKIEAEGIVVLHLNWEFEDLVNFAKDIKSRSGSYKYTGSELSSNLEDIISDVQYWGYSWKVVTRPESKTTDVPTTNIIEQWLDRLQHVYTNDDSISNFIVYHKVEITTDHGDILGSKQVVEFINNRYSQLKSAENQSKLKELQAKKDKLMLELASVDGEINELGGVV